MVNNTSLTFSITRNGQLGEPTFANSTLQYRIKYDYEGEEDYRSVVDITNPASFTISDLEDGVSLAPGITYTVNPRSWITILGEESTNTILHQAQDTTSGLPDPPTDLAITLEDVGSTGRTPNLVLNFTRNPGTERHQWRARSGSSSFSDWQRIQLADPLPFMPGIRGTFYPSNVTTVFELSLIHI